jgi:hypothetical protein
MSIRLLAATAALALLAPFTAQAGAPAPGPGRPRAGPGRRLDGVRATT